MVGVRGARPRGGVLQNTLLAELYSFLVVVLLSTRSVDAVWGSLRRGVYRSSTEGPALTHPLPLRLLMD